jgi:diguanylate cyclase (GGDEF)-like protein
MLLRHIAENGLNRLAGLVFPAVVLGISAFTVHSYLERAQARQGTELSLQALEQRGEAPGRHTDIAAEVQLSPVTTSASTDLSTRPFWLVLSANAPQSNAPWAIEFPSRHASGIECWDRDTDSKLGRATRDEDDGLLGRSRGGFALNLPADRRQATVLCKTSFRGPAKLTAKVWDADALKLAQVAHAKAGAMIEAGLGLLALAMLLMAIINRSALYSSLVVWLLLSMRMASLSAGTDFDLLGVPLSTDWLIPSRQWTVCMYSAATVALFGQLFKRELAARRSRRLLTGLQLGAIALLVACPLLSFEQILPVVWSSSAAGIGIMLYYLYGILRRSFTAMALWYALSIAVTLLASLNEVVAAAMGPTSLLRNLNSVSAALASALFVFAAAAEHMRLGRKQMIAAQKSLKTAYDDSPIGLFTLHDGDRLVNSNQAFNGMLKGLSQVDMPRLSQIFGADVADEIQRLRTGPLPLTVELQTSLILPGMSASEVSWFAVKLSTQDGRVVEGSLQDISEKVRATHRLEFLVNHDPLTECLNLRGLSRHFEAAFHQAKALAYFDLDRFKLINDLYGHSAGDAVLRQVCERMRSQLGPDDCLARVGGDEFVVTFADSSLAAARACCAKIGTLISSTPFQIDTQRFELSVSAGLVTTEHLGATSLKEVISAADSLCRVAKKRTPERLVVMEGGSAFLQHHKVELELISCLERGETPRGLFLLMQPELSLSQPFNSLNFEALVRMRKPNGEIVPASVIIEAAEAHSKTAIIDLWVVKTLLAWLETHREQLALTQFVGVNLSGGSLNDEAFVEALFVLLERHPRVVPMLCLEITETVALTDMRHMQRLIGRLQAIGAKVGLDDFGAGFSSFGYLKGLSVDALKLDGSLVKDAAQTMAGVAILGALGGLVRNLGMKSVGEFAENLQTIKALVAAGVDYAQGYGISKPVSPERILAARSAADFIEDPMILEYVRQLQSQPATGLSALVESDDASAPVILH